MQLLTIFLPYADLIVRLGVAIILGGLVGTERTISHRRAGMRTYALVSLGACLFILVGELVAPMSGNGTDTLRIASQIITGIGFLGAGLIIVKGTHISGLTTAAGLWVAAGIGMAAGFGLYVLALLATLFTLFVLVILRSVEDGIKEKVE